MGASAERTRRYLKVENRKGDLIGVETLVDFIYDFPDLR